MTFKLAQIKLTLWYLLIVMMISVMFSVLVYMVAFREVSIFSARQSTELRRVPPAPALMHSDFNIDDFEKVRNKQLSELKAHMIQNLLLTNLAILVLAGLASYAFARRTLGPIEEMVERQHRFTTDASHEFRTPLAAMKLETEVALRDNSFSLSDARKLLKSNLEEISKLENLSNGLLELARFGDIQLKINKQTDSVSIISVVKNVVERFELLAQNKKIKIITKLNQASVKIDQDQFSKILAILIDNAIKYSPEKTAIKIETKIEKKFFVLNVADQGVGIKNNELPYIFDRFYRSDLSRSKNQRQGFGLGLAIAKNIVKASNGQIEVKSQVGKGTTFTVKFPV